MERDELACVAASYGIDFDHGKDVKTDIIKKLEKARNTGRGLLMITDDRYGNMVVEFQAFKIVIDKVYFVKIGN